MKHTFTLDEARSFRLRSQQLHPTTTAISVEDAIAGVCGIQAQDLQAAMLAVWSRSHDTTESDVETALFEDRSIVRTWGMRGSLHLLATNDLPWVSSLFGPVFVARSKTRLSNLGFDDDACEQAMQEIESLLADNGPLTRDEITTALQHFSIDAAERGAHRAAALERTGAFRIPYTALDQLANGSTIPPPLRPLTSSTLN